LRQPIKQMVILFVCLNNSNYSIFLPWPATRNDPKVSTDFLPQMFEFSKKIQTRVSIINNHKSRLDVTQGIRNASKVV